MEFKEPHMELLEEIADLKEKLETITALVGAKFEPEGSITFNMPKYHAAHRCERHEGTNWKEDEEWRECNGCLQERLDERQEQITRLSEANARLAETGERASDIHTINISAIVELQSKLARYRAALAEDLAEEFGAWLFMHFGDVVPKVNCEDVAREWLRNRRHAAEGKTT